VSSSSLYGGTYNLFAYTLKELGVEVSFVDDPDDLDAWQAAVRPNTKAFFAETIGNPRNNVLDVAGVASIAHGAGAPLVVDNTVATPYLLRPLEWGADVVVHSATKYLGGHGTVIAGVVVDGGSFDFGAEPGRWPQFHIPDPSYHGVVFWDLLGADRIAYATVLRVKLLRDLGPATAPFNAFLLLQGIETLSLRLDRHVANAQAIAEWLEGRDEVENVLYAGLPSSPWYAAAQQYLPRGAGAVVAFEIRGGSRLVGGSLWVWSCSVTWRTLVMSVRWSSILPRPPTRNWTPSSSWPPVSPRVWCGWPSGWKGSRTSRPTSTPGSAPPSPRDPRWCHRCHRCHRCRLAASVAAAGQPRLAGCAAALGRRGRPGRHRRADVPGTGPLRGLLRAGGVPRWPSAGRRLRRPAR
jgi:hypothetical protein